MGCGGFHRCRSWVKTMASVVRVIEIKNPGAFILREGSCYFFFLIFPLVKKHNSNLCSRRVVRIAGNERERRCRSWEVRVDSESDYVKDKE